MILFLFQFACSPASVVLSSDTELQMENTTSDDTSDNSDSSADRCCYTIEMYDTAGDGWDEGFLKIMVDNEFYDNISLVSGNFGFHEVCPKQGSSFEAYWNRSRHNNEVAIEIYSPSEELIVQERAPGETSLVSIDVECDSTLRVDDDYVELYDIGDGSSPIDPVEPGESIFEGSYNADFFLYNRQTDYVVCQTGMTINITGEEVKANGSCTADNNIELKFTHQGFLEEMDWGNDGPGGPGGGPNDFNFAQVYGMASMEIPGGEVFSTEMYGECYNEYDYFGVALYWDLTIQAPNGTRYYSGELYAY